MPHLLSEIRLVQTLMSEPGRVVNGVGVMVSASQTDATRLCSHSAENLERISAAAFVFMNET